jgi:hypothetical protein
MPKIIKRKLGIILRFHIITILSKSQLLFVYFRPVIQMRIIFNPLRPSGKYMNHLP